MPIVFICILWSFQIRKLRDPIAIRTRDETLAFKVFMTGSNLVEIFTADFG